MRRRWIHFIAVLFFFAGGSHLALAAEDSLARIVQVRRTATTGTPHDVNRLRLPKFLGSDTYAAGDEYQVIWEPASGRALDDVVVSFEYAQKRASGVRSLSIAYPFNVHSRRVATFAIADRAYQVGGRVTRWRVRVRQGERILAENVSPHWRASQ